jgi:heme exporter protein B
VSGTTFWQQAYQMGLKDVRVEGRSGEVLYITVPFGAVALLLIPIAIGTDAPLLAQIGPGMFWAVTLLFGMLVTFRQSASDTLAQREMLALLGTDPAARFTGRVAASTLLLMAFQFVLAPLTVVLYNPDPVGGWPLLGFVMILLAVGLALVGTLASGVTAGLRTRATLAPLLVAPLSLPLLVGSSQAYESLRADRAILAPVLLLVAVDLGLAVVGVLTARFLEEASR